MCNMLKTIFALSSGYGKCGVSVVRVSGPRASASLLTLLKASKLPKPRAARLAPLYDPQNGEPIDRGLILWFPSPKSFTGEDVVEYQVHGGIAVVKALLTSLGRMADHRPALAGEFTKRAFQNGKMDLTSVEGLGDLIHAETEIQRKQALRQMNGELFKIFGGWREDLIRITAHIEAHIDFEEAEHFENSEILRDNNFKVRKLIGEIDNYLADFRAGDRLRNGVKVVIYGKPNVGKSTLLNYLVRRNAAIVSDIAGTTRDVIECKIDIGGYPIIISDTAGVRADGSDVIEREGIHRAIDEAKNADLVIHLKDCDENDILEFSRTLTVVNKVDLNGFPGGISLKTGEGLDGFMSNLKDNVKELCTTGNGECSSFNRTRYKIHLENTKKYLGNFLETIENNESESDIAAHYLRLAVREVGFITGKIDPEKIFDVIFGDFCIGK